MKAINTVSRCGATCTVILGLALAACAPQADHTAAAGAAAGAAVVISHDPEEGESRHLSNIRQLTDGGENAEAYFSADGKRLIFQSTRDDRSCDLQFTMNIDGSDVRLVSPKAGKTTCGYFYAGDSRIFFASTHAADSACPPRPDPSQGYVWGLDKFDIYTANADGTGLQRLTDYGVYTAEGTLSPDGQTIVFTSNKDGDLDIYTMRVDGSDVRRLTNRPGYDGGAFFSHDGASIVYRAYHPTDPAELSEYRDLLSRSIVRPSKMEIWVMDADGSNQRQVTTLGGANFAPYFTPDDKRIIFSSNYENPRGGNFDLFLIDVDGSNLEKVTTHGQFDGFPQFSPDGTKLVWASGRKTVDARGLNILIADWK
jgi:Tol biopolymer transport system component